MNVYEGQDSIIFGENYIAEDLLKKGHSWKHEEEWRILQNNIQEDFFEYGDDLACVIFGCKTKLKLRKRIEKHIPNGVHIFTVKPDLAKFCLFAEDEIGNMKFYDVKEL